MPKLLALGRDFDLFRRVRHFDERLISSDLYPPLPVADGSLVWGFGLLEEAARLGKAELVCLEIPGHDRIELLKIALALEGRGGRYSWEERVSLYQFIERSGFTEKTDEIVLLIEEQRLPAWKEKVTAFLSFSPSLRQLVNDELLDFKTAQRTKALPDFYFAHLDKEKEGHTYSERRMLTEYLWEIIQRDQPAEGKRDKLIRKILHEPYPLKSALALRYPELTALTARFEEITASLQKRGIAVSPPQSFEGDAFQFVFSCTSKAVFKKRLQALLDFEEQIDRLFKLL